MKKLVLMVVAACAMCFTACQNKNQQVPVDQLEVNGDTATVNVDEAVSAATAEIAQQLEAGDANKLQAAIEAVKAKVAEILKENPEAAKEYIGKVQTFLKENAEKIKAVAGDNAAVQAAVSALTEAPADKVVNGLMEVVNGVQEAGQQAVDGATEAANAAVEQTKQAAQDKANEVKEEAKQKANEAIDGAADKAKKALGL